MGKASHSSSSETLPFPPGFTPASTGKHQVSDTSHINSEDSASFKFTRFSMLECIEEMIKVGLALGLNMEGCKTTLASLVAEK